MKLEPFTVDLPLIDIDETLSNEIKFTYFYRQLQRSTRLKQRQMTLYYAFKIGQLIETLSLRSQKLFYKNQMTTHFY